MLTAALGLARAVPLWAWAGVALVAWGSWQRMEAKAAHAKLESERAAAITEVFRRSEIAAGASARYEGHRAQLQQHARVITKEIDRVVEKPVYRDGLCFDADGLRLLSESIAGAADPGQPAAAVPAASAAR